MTGLFELRRRAHLVAIPGVGLFLLGYLAYHAVEGERGVIAWHQLTNRVAATRAGLAESEVRRSALARKVALLRPDDIDLDMLDEQARRILMLAAPDDLIVLSPRRAEKGDVAN